MLTLPSTILGTAPSLQTPLDLRYPKPDRHEKINISTLTYAFQPIVNIHTGACIGYEALLRGCDQLGYASIQAFFDEAYRNHRLPSLEHQLHQKVFSLFCQIPHFCEVKLFYNLDPRTFRCSISNSEIASWPDFLDKTTRELQQYNIHPSAFCFELTEHVKADDIPTMLESVQQCRKKNFSIALDDFGTGFSGLQLLYQVESDFIKIDRFFIKDIPTDSRKRVFATNMVNIAHTLGIKVVAEGVETAREFYSCRDIGFDLVQGYFVQPPTMILSQLQKTYEVVSKTRSEDRRRSNRSDQNLIMGQMAEMEPILLEDNLLNLFEYFRRNKNFNFFPVVNRSAEPVGIIRERDIKDIVYSQYGRDLLKNRAFASKVTDFVTKCPVADIHSKTEKILDLFSQSECPEGVIIVQDMKYVGFLSASSLLKVIHEKKLVQARDQNPLSHLPGNYMVYEYLHVAAQNTETGYAFAYLDFDNFKPFNDRYGFREGDRALLLFADILKKEFIGKGFFIGHIGGDDFFMGFENLPTEVVCENLRKVTGRFKREVESFYHADDRQNGFIIAKDRDGQTRQIPLLTISSALVIWPPHHLTRSVEDLSHCIASLKKQAKVIPEKLCISVVGEPATEPA